MLYYFTLYCAITAVILRLSFFSRQLYPDLQAELDKIQTHLLDTSHEIGAFKVWQFQELSHQAAERIMKSSADALNVLTDISQNFPMQVCIFFLKQDKLYMKNYIYTEMYYIYMYTIIAMQ